MNTKVKKTFPLFFILLSVIAFVAGISFVKADTYNWLSNSGFENYGATELISGGSFMTDSLDGTSLTATLYPAVFSSSYYVTSQYFPPSGSAPYSLSLPSSSSPKYWINFSSSIATSSVEEFYVYYLSRSYPNSPRITFNVYYTDGSDDTYTKYLSSYSNNSVWVNLDLKQMLIDNDAWDNGKYLTAIEFHNAYTYGAYFDELHLKIYATGQTAITTSSSPWYIAVGTFEGAIVGTVHNGGSYSLAMGTTSVVPVAGFRQRVNYLPSNNVTEVSLWSTTGNSNAHRLRCYLYYSDGSYTYQDIDFVSYGSWTKLTFDEVIVPDKYIVLIDIQKHARFTDTTLWVDDISLTANIAYDESTVFEYRLLPVPIEYLTDATTSDEYITMQGFGLGFSQYFGIKTIMQCNINFMGSGIENGTFIVMSNDVNITGTISMGYFDFTLVERTGTANAVEIITILMTTELRELHVEITAFWVYNGAINPDIDGGLDNATHLIIQNFMLLFIFVIVPSFILAFYAGRNNLNPMFGFFGGLCITVPIGYIAGLVPLWFLFLIVIVIVVIFLMLLKQSGRF